MNEAVLQQDMKAREQGAAGSALSDARPGESGTVAKACHVLKAVAGTEDPVRFMDLLNRLPYPKATLHRLLRTLVSEGMLDFDRQQQTYHPGLALLRLAHAAWTKSSLVDAARDALDRLSGEIDQTIHLAVLDDAQVLYVDKRIATHPVTMFSSTGKVGPAYCTGVGKTMLAHLSEGEIDIAIGRQAFHKFTQTTILTAPALMAELQDIRNKGYGFDREEHEPDIICVAVPILSHTGDLLGGLSVTSATYLSSLADLEHYVPRMQGAAEEIAQQAEFRLVPVT